MTTLQGVYMRLGVLCIGMLLLGACVSLSSSKKEPERPKITDQTSLKEAIAFGVDFGGDTLVATKRLIKKRGEWSKAEELLFGILMNQKADWSTGSLINAVDLFKTSGSQRAYKVFHKMAREGKLIKKRH